VNRVIGRVDATGAVDISTALGDAISGGNPRGAASTNGIDRESGGPDDLRCTDVSGNGTSAPAIVVVPHDQGK
jgi:hypothetical protein